MFTGMLDAVADIDQLIIVLGHEMAHAVLEHSVSTKASAVFVDFCGIASATDSVMTLSQSTDHRITLLFTVALDLSCAIDHTQYSKFYWISVNTLP